MYSVLDLVGAGLGITLVPASSSLLGIRGVTFRALEQKTGSEGLALLRRKVEANPVLPLVEESVEATFASISQQIAHLVNA